MTDPLTGLEVELLLPEGATRQDLAEGLAAAAGLRVEPFAFSQAVPVPSAAELGVPAHEGPDAITSFLADKARVHGARAITVSPDGATALLAFDAYRLRAPDDRVVLEVVHDVTVAGAARACELVTAPFRDAGLPFVLALLEWIQGIEGVSLPPSAALHVHVDAGALTDARRLHALARAFSDVEPAWRARWGGEALTSAQPLPAGVLEALELLSARDADLRETRGALGPLVRDKKCALNLYNIVHAVDDKPTVELKLARATLDPQEVTALRAAFVALVLSAAR